PHICTVYDVGEHQGRPFLAMERLEGRTLRQRIAEGPLPVDEVLALGAQVADALAAAHAARIVHRDLKPANIFLTERGDAKLLDFGLAKEIGAPLSGSAESTASPEDELTGVGKILGTVSYMSPEQCRGEPVDGRTDIFSLGVVLCE